MFTRSPFGHYFICSHAHNLLISDGRPRGCICGDCALGIVETCMFCAYGSPKGWVLSVACNSHGDEKWVIAMELYPGFALYRGLYKLGQYSTLGASVGGHGMKWENLSDSSNGMKEEVMIIMVVEWLLVLPIAFFVDQLILSVAGLKKCSLICLPNLWKKSSPTAQKPSLQKSSSKVFVHMDKSDVSQEREKVEQLLEEGSLNAAVICDNLAKVYPGRDGNPPKAAVRGLSLALPRGECFGMLGPNGA